MSWHYLPELAAACSVPSSMAGAPSAPSRSMSTAAMCSCSGSVMECSTCSQSGTTCRPSTGDPGVDAWILSRAASRARTSAPPERASVLRENEADCGESSRGSLARYDRDSRSWKTRQGLLAGGLAEYSETWPKWGSMRDGDAYRQKTPSGLAEHRASITSAKESGSSQHMPTPNCEGFRSDGELRILARLNMPPEQFEAMTRRACRSKKDKALKVATPTVCGNNNRKVSSETSGDGLATVIYEAEKLATPTARDWKSGKASQETMEPNASPLSEQVGGSLNPTWVEWLMGWPENWTILSEMSRIEYLQWYMENSKNGAKERKREVLRVLRSGDVAKEIQGCTGVDVSVQESAILFALVCQQKNLADKARLLMACSKVLEREMRSVRSSESSSGSPSGSGHNQQLERKHSDLVQVLPRLLAHYGEAPWMGHRRETAALRIAKDVTHRMGRIRALGNGQVPAVVRLAWRILRGVK